MLDYGDLRFTTIYHRSQRLRLTPLRRDHMDELSRWPKFNTLDMQWANFFPTNSVQKNRWFKDNTGGRKLWFAGERTSNNWRSTELICRISLIIPIHGEDIIFGIVVHPNLLERGLGTKFTQMILAAIASKTTASGVWLETHHTNKRAQHVYEKVGFENFGYSYHKGFTPDHDQFLNYRISRDRMEKLDSVVMVLNDANA